MYLSKMTVAELREIAKRMGPKSNPISGLRKAELVSLISKWIELDHQAAIKENEQREELKVKTFNSLTVMDRDRIYKAQTNGRLTRRQRRRIAKKYAQGRKRGFGLDTVMGASV